MIKTTDYNSNRRVVVTGLGVVSSLGIGWQEFWKNLLAGKSGISRITAFDTSPYDRHYGGEVKNFDPTKFMSRKKAERLGRASQMAIAASKLALKDAHLNLKDINGLKSGVCIGTTMGEPQIMEKVDEKSFREGDKLKYDSQSSMSYPACLIANQVGSYFKFEAVNAVFSTACSSGNYAIARAYDLIRTGKCDFMLAGGSDALSRIAFTGFGRLYAMAPEKCCPFDKNREGMILGEGSGILFLESFKTAQKHRAQIYAEILGYGMSCDAYHMSEPKVGGVVKALDKAIRNSRVKPANIDYISAHGTGTMENDEAESMAINRVFGKKTENIPVSATKSMLGHTMGASAAFGAIACCLAIRDGRIPPTINHEHDDPKCAIDCVPNVGRKHRVKIALNNAQAFGGNNACVAFQNP